MKLFVFFALLCVTAAEIIGESKFADFPNTFREDIDAFMTANPTGRPEYVVKFIHDKFREHAQNLMGQRPTGRPMTHADHKDRHDHHKAMTQLHQAKNSALRQTWWSHFNQAQGDETEIIGQVSKFAEFHKGFRADVSDFLKAGPTGRPQDILQFINQKFREAKKNLQSVRPTGRPSSLSEHVDKSDHEHAVWKLNVAKDKAVQQARNWLHQLNKMNQAEGDETEILSPMKTHIDNFQSALDQFRQENPSASRTEVFKTLSKLFDEHRDNIKEMRPTGRPSKNDREAYWDAVQALEEAYEAAIDAHEEIRKQKLIAGYKPHLETFQEALEKILASKDGMTYDEINTILSKLKDTHVNQLNGMRPTGRPNLADREGFNLASEQLQDAYREAKDGLTAWKKQLDREE